MKKLAKAVADNPYVTIFIEFITFLGFIAALVIPYIQARKVQLNFSYTSNLLVSDILSEMEGLDISFQGSKVGQLTVTTCEICNTGNTTIEDSDVYEGHKLRVFTGSDNAEVLFASVVSQSYDTNNCQLSYDGNSVNVHFDVLEKKEKVVFNIYHTGDADTAFSIEGKIKEGKIREGDSLGQSILSNNLLLAVITLVAANMCIFMSTDDKFKILFCILEGILILVWTIVVF